VDTAFEPSLAAATSPAPSVADSDGGHADLNFVKANSALWLVRCTFVYDNDARASVSNVVGILIII
jgi:hypothetical protein